MKTADHALDSVKRPDSGNRDGHPLGEAPVRPLRRKISARLSPLAVAMASSCFTGLLLHISGERMNSGDNSAQVDLVPASIVALFAFASAHLYLLLRRAIGRRLWFHACVIGMSAVALLPAITFSVCAAVSGEAVWSYGVVHSLLPANVALMFVVVTLAAWTSPLDSGHSNSDHIRSEKPLSLEHTENEVALSDSNEAVHLSNHSPIEDGFLTAPVSPVALGLRARGRMTS